MMFNILAAIQPSITVAGKVNIQERTMSKTSCHRTVETLLAAPAPTIEEVIVWVVETGIPKIEAPGSTRAAEVSAENPCSTERFVTLRPNVLIILQPPKAAPNPAANPTDKITQIGTITSAQL